LRSSDRRRTADQIIKDLDVSIPNEHSENAEEKAAATVQRSSLRTSLLPDNALSARFTTTHGPNLKQVSGTVYVGSHDCDEQRVLWVSLNGKMYPTVYTLWKNSGIVPLLHCGSNVIERLQDGADLMIPGLINGPPFPEKAKKGAIVAIAGHDRPSVPVVVGRCEVDVSGLQVVRGIKGQAVETFHWSGDEIWSWNVSGRPGGEPPDRLDGWLGDDKGVESLQEQTEGLDLNDGEEKDGAALPAEHASNGDDEAEEHEPSGKDFSTAGMFALTILERHD
jgi:translation initiation factor 2D